MVPDGTGRGARLPWWGKMAAKAALTRLLPGYGWRRRLGVGVHSHADATAGQAHMIAYDVDWFVATFGRPPRTLLELGPGDSVANALHAAARGVERTWLVDVGDFAARDMAGYRRVAEGIGGGLAARVDFSSRETMLASLGARYLTGGVADLAAVPDDSIELTVSYTVLEHVRRAEMAALMGELFRVATPGGLGHHVIDLMDHLGGGLNHLRFSDPVWEHPWMAGSGFYTNRLGRRDFLAIAGAAGFATAVPYVQRWPVLPIAERAIHPRFHGRGREELRVALFGLQTRKG